MRAGGTSLSGAMTDDTLGQTPAARRLHRASQYFMALRGQFKLDEWEYTLIDVINPEVTTDYIVSCSVTPSRHDATFRIKPQFWSETPADQRNTVVHEWLHVLLARTWESIRTSELEKSLGEPMWHRLYEQWRMGNEYDVDRLAALLAPQFPLPSKFEDEG